MTSAEELVRREARRPVSLSNFPGRTFARGVRLVGLAGGWNETAVRLAEQYAPELMLDIKAAVAASTTGAGVGAALTTPMLGGLEIVNLARPRTIAGRLARLAVVPFIDAAAVATAGPSMAFVAEGAAIPVSRLTWTPAALQRLKLAGIAAVSRGLLEAADPAADTRIRDIFVDALVEALDAAFISDAAAVAGVSPAGVAADAPIEVSSGNVLDDVRELLAGFTTLDGVSVVLSEASLIELGLAAPGAIQGGRLFGTLPLIPSSAAADTMVAIHAPRVLYADDGQLAVDVARNATLQMDDAPDHEASTPTASNSLVSLWQTNTVGFRLVRYVNWSALSGSVRTVTGCTYGIEAAS